MSLHLGIAIVICEPPSKSVVHPLLKTMKDVVINDFLRENLVATRSSQP